MSAIEADSNSGAEHEDASSGYYSESGDGSYTTSLKESVRKYTYDNGRRYNGFGDMNWEPNDDRQQDVLDLMHHTSRLALKGDLYRAPIGKNPQRILDLGTGTGIYAMEMGDEFPSAEVIGNDLSPIQPAWVPPNVRFEVDDFNLPWTYTKESFDFIHARCLYGSIPDGDKLYSEVFKALKPGGYMEHVEYGIIPLSDDGTVTEEFAVYKTALKSLDAGLKLGCKFQIIDDIRGWFERAGFVDIVEETVKIPFNAWPKDPKLQELGRFMYTSLAEGMHGFLVYIYSAGLGMGKEEISKIVQETMKAMRNRSTHGYYPMKIVYGKKPEA